MPDNPSGASLGARMVRGAGWIIAWRLCSRLFGLLNTVVLVRLLTPADFGLVALATSLTQTLESFVNVGVADALIRETKLDRMLYDTGFTMNLVRCALVGIVILICAAPAGWFFADTRLTDILLTLAVMTFLSGCENIGIIDFRRALFFQKEFMMAVLPRLTGIATSMACAIIFRNYWALVAGLVSSRLLRLFLTYAMHPYRPRLSLRAWRKIFGYSIWTWLCSIVVMVKDRADSIVIGRILGPAQVGIYAVGLELGTLASTELVEPLATALFAGFAAGQREGIDNRQVFFNAVAVALMLTLPIGVGISLVAAPLVTLLLGTRWSDAILLVQIFALLGVTRLIMNFSSALLSASNLLNVQIRIQVIGMATRVSLLLILVTSLGLVGAAIAATACAAVEESLFLIVTFRHFKLRISQLIARVWRAMGATSLMALVVWAEGIGWAPSPTTTGALIASLAIGVGTGAITYCGAVIALWWLSGRPDGAETALLEIMAHSKFKFVVRWLRQPSRRLDHPS